VFRGDETFAVTTKEAAAILEGSGRGVAANEIHEALKDISRRPEPDRTGAIQHAIAALECTAREVTGETRATLGALLPKLGLPKPLDAAVGKLWGFASDRARHLREGQNPDDLEAELVVSVACAVSAFLAKRTRARREKTRTWNIRLDELKLISSLLRSTKVADEKRKQKWREKGDVRQKQLFPKNRLSRFKKNKRENGDRKDLS
jgi:hypothetical protein